MVPGRRCWILDAFHHSLCSYDATFWENWKMLEEKLQTIIIKLKALLQTQVKERLRL